MDPAGGTELTKSELKRLQQQLAALQEKDPKAARGALEKLKEKLEAEGYVIEVTLLN
jgi:hypothetical protein